MLNLNLANVNYVMFSLEIELLSALPHFYLRESTLGYMGKFFNNGSMTTKFHILNEFGGHAKDAGDKLI